MKAQLYQQMHAVEGRHWWFRGRRRIVASMLQALELPTGSEILDLGCGTGGNLAMLSGFGRVTGVEMDHGAAELARQGGNGRVLEGFLPDHLPVPEGAYACVTMLDVLEHIEQDAASLDAVQRLLAPGGCLLLTVPAFPFLWGPHDEAHHHRRRYRAKNLRRRLQDAGFRVRKLSYYNFWLFPPVALVRIVRKLVPAGEAGVELTLPTTWLNRVLEGLFASERWLLRRARFPFGVSLIAVAQKGGDA